MSNEQAGIPAELTEALSENETAEKIFAALPSSHQNEYLRWIGEAKRAETRQRRAAKAVEMMVDKHGKSSLFLTSSVRRRRPGGSPRDIAVVVRIKGLS